MIADKSGLDCDELILTGKSQSHLALLSDQRTLLHAEACRAFEQMKQGATLSGIDIQICSSFRGYERQAQIWNEKAQGKRELLDYQGVPVKFDTLARSELLFAILRWSAIPGASRHHWGTDIDLFDGLALPKSYQLKLTCDEYGKEGIFSKLASWLEPNAPKYGLFQPYRDDHGGIHPEPWHWSYAPVSLNFTQGYTLDLFRRTISDADIELKPELLEHLEPIYQRFVVNIDRP